MKKQLIEIDIRVRPRGRRHGGSAWMSLIHAPLARGERSMITRQVEVLMAMVLTEISVASAGKEPRK